MRSFKDLDEFEDQFNEENCRDCRLSAQFLKAYQDLKEEITDTLFCERLCPRSKLSAIAGIINQAEENLE